MSLQVRDPAVDSAEDGWTTIEAHVAAHAACRFRRLRQLPPKHIVEVMGPQGVFSFPGGMRVGYERLNGAAPKPPVPKKVGRSPGYGQKPKDTATIIRELESRPGMTCDELMAEVFGPDAMPLFKEMLAFRGTLFNLKRSGEIENEGGRYSLPEKS